MALIGNYIGFDPLTIIWMSDYSCIIFDEVILNMTSPIYSPATEPVLGVAVRMVYNYLGMLTLKIVAFLDWFLNRTLA